MITVLSGTNSEIVTNFYKDLKEEDIILFPDMGLSESEQREWVWAFCISYTNKYGSGDYEICDIYVITYSLVLFTEFRVCLKHKLLSPKHFQAMWITNEDSFILEFDENGKSENWYKAWNCFGQQLDRLI